MATTSKNGYEIRSDLLGLAKSLVEFNYQAQIQEFKAPTLAATDIINIAKQFNEFVTNNDYTKSVQDNVEKAQELAKPYAEAYQNTVKAFFPNLKGK